MSLDIGDGQKGVVVQHLFEVRDQPLLVGGEALLSRVAAETVADMGLCPGLPVTALIKSVALER